MALYLLIFPIGVVSFLIKYKQVLRQPNWEGRFGALYLNIKIEDKYAYLQTLLFLLRRLILAMSIVFAP